MIVSDFYALCNNVPSLAGAEAHSVITTQNPHSREISHTHTDFALDSH